MYLKVKCIQIQRLGSNSQDITAVAVCINTMKTIFLFKFDF